MAFPVDFSLDRNRALAQYRYQLPVVSSTPLLFAVPEDEPTIAERVDGYQHMSNVGLSLQVSTWPGNSPARRHSTHVDFCILEPLLQIVIDSLVRYLADKGEIRDPNLLFLRALKHGFSDLRLPSSLPSTSLFGTWSILPPSCAFCDPLKVQRVSISELYFDPIEWQP